ncbi:MAG: SsrA-binding protein, partial [Planctomycetaceae bacterium]|nr:SsrA-binding protein [Planctomycetaceae bacterium]
MASSKPTNSGKSSKGASAKGDLVERVVAENRKARHHYEILDTLE